MYKGGVYKEARRKGEKSKKNEGYRCRGVQRRRRRRRRRRKVWCVEEKAIV